MRALSPDPADVVGAVRAHAAARGGDPAIRDGRVSFTYAELLDRASTRAGALVRRGVAPGDRVGIHLPNCADYVVTILACLMAGAAFVPIPYSDPEYRILGIARDCDVTLTVTPGASPERNAMRAVPLDELDATPDPATPGRAAGAEDIVYLVYTSGTTGRPKGVMIRRRSLHNFIANTVEAFGLSACTRALCVSPFHFDGAFGSIFAVLAVGGSLVVADHSPLLPADFFQLLLSEEITHTSFSPSFLRLLTASRDLPLLARSRLRTIGLGGEDCTPDQVARLLDRLPRLRVFNRYGPTETTVVVATHLVTRELCESGRKIPVGRPDPGVEFHLIDGEGRLLTAPRALGELCVGGVQVMAGYWGAPRPTEEVLRDDLVPGSRVYRTGDLMERTEDGNYVYLDRADNVTKRDGNRISMTEVTAALLAVPGVRDAVALAEHRNGRTLIHAYAVAPHLDAATVRGELLRKVPAYMNPDSLRIIAEIPRLSGGKPDARRLRA